MGKSGQDKNISPAQSRFVNAMLTERDIQSAADAAGVAVKTGYRWHKLPEIRQALDLANSEALEGTMRRLVALGALALDALEGVLQDSGATYHARLRAADIVLSKVLVWREVVDIEGRLQALELAGK